MYTDVTLALHGLCTKSNQNTWQLTMNSPNSGCSLSSETSCESLKAMETEEKGTSTKHLKAELSQAGRDEYPNVTQQLGDLGTSGDLIYTMGITSHLTELT